MTYKEYFEARLNNLPKTKIGNVEFYEQELNELTESGDIYVITFKKIYQICPANYKPGFIPYYGKLVFSSPEQLCKRGRYYTMNAKGVNNLLGQEIFV